MSDRLTKYEEGGCKELFSLAYPMILAFLSGNAMMFADRLFLANYSMAAMNAAAAAGLIVAVFQYGAAVIASISEVFVGRSHGAGRFDEVSSPAWQMLWFSLGALGVFLLVAKWGGPYLLPEYHYHDEGLPYYQWLLCFSAAVPAIAALSGFFAGIGKTRCVMMITVAGNAVNLILDPLLIFGVSEWFAPMGAKGAAIATGLSQLIQLILFGFVFFSREYRTKYATSSGKINAPLFLRCLKTSVPNAIGHMIEWAAWAVTIRMMAFAGEHHLTVATIGQSMYMLVAFGFEGLQKATTALASNRIGACKYDNIWSVWRSAVKLLLAFAVPFGAAMLLYPDPIIAEFLSTETPPSDVALLTPMLRITAAGVFLYYLLDGFTWICVGVLTAAEDTWFVMWANGLTAWTCGMSPILLFMVYLQCSPAWYFVLISFYGGCNAIIFYRRLLKEPWLSLHRAK